MNFIVLSYRRWGEPKLIKPLILKGLKPSFKTVWNKRLSFNCFIVNDDVYVQHNDWYSGVFQPINKLTHFSDINTKIEEYNKFIAEDDKEKINLKRGSFCYNDCFADIILRGNAWLKFENIIIDIRNNNYIGSLWYDIEYQQKEWQNKYLNIKDDLLSCDYRFIRNFISNLRKVCKNGI